MITPIVLFLLLCPWWTTFWGAYLWCATHNCSLMHIRPYDGFGTLIWVNINGFSTNLVCALISWSSGFGLLNGHIWSIWRVGGSRGMFRDKISQSEGRKDKWILKDIRPVAGDHVAKHMASIQGSVLLGIDRAILGCWIVHILFCTLWSWSSCSKLTMSLVNLSLKLWSLNMAYALIFLLKKIVSSYSHFFSKIPVN